MNIKLARFFKFLGYGGLRGHFSQYGEDVFLHKFFRGKKNGFYIDVGAHHPFQLSNTAYLWISGWNGVNVDASEKAIQLFSRVRPHDLNIRAAVVSTDYAINSSEIEFYSSREIDNSATCDAQLARERGYEISVKVPCRSLSGIVSEASKISNGIFDYLNIDIEGLDESVLEDISSWVMKPRVIMVEIYGESVRDVISRPATINLENNGYKFLERTGHTAIFVRSIKNND
jgi:FkbM family methyltransferase